jgi:hypothetical protein
LQGVVNLVRQRLETGVAGMQFVALLNAARRGGKGD